MGHGRNRWILVVVRTTLRYVTARWGQVIDVIQRLIYTNNFATSAALAEVCVLLSAILVYVLANEGQALSGELLPGSILSSQNITT